MYRLAPVVLLVLSIACTAPSGAAPPPSATQPASTPEAVIAHLKAAGLPITGEVVYTAETDTNKLLGRPGQYTAKANWLDARAPEAGDANTVEIFATDADRKTRQDYVAAAAKSPIFAEYGYAKGRVLLRVAGRLSPDQAAEYDRALQTLP
jgi:hypothetical protein